MSGRDLNEELSLERLRDMQSRRRAREQSHMLSLVERAAILAVTVAGAIFALIHSIG
jgi:hypothetical protein